MYYIADELGFRPKVERIFNVQAKLGISDGVKDDKTESPITSTTPEFVNFIGSAVLATLSGKK